ncbi:cytosolic sulfotransferase 12 [Eucalyptus grandis]|uniref:cytosolic sulfotransferase 12 n=1 Tax=Eucalyptus grandis TaxID=71139 RepID=UPI00192EC76A|nr:cytosolic sulfotransferase 12 [Eucalyptus grandis]
MHLGFTQIRELPSSIGGLESLAALHLWGSKIVEVPTPIGNLKKLECLVLLEINIREQPKDMGMLENFKVLESDGCRNITWMGESPKANKWNLSINITWPPQLWSLNMPWDDPRSLTWLPSNLCHLVPHAVASDLSSQEELLKEQIALECQGAEKREVAISSSLPREQGWLTQHLYNYQGFWYDNHFLGGVIWAQQHFEARPTDTLLATFPKTGLTWIKALSFAIANRHNQDLPRHTLLTKNPHECVPFIEFFAYEKDPISALHALPSPRLLSTHIPYASLPRSVATSGCRIVCIVRDPKDVFVSMWSFISKVKYTDSDRPPVSLEEAFGLFSRGVSLSGPYWDHVLGYWKASLEYPNKVLILKFEDLKRETEPNVKRLANFLGCPFTPEEIDGGGLQEIIKLCSIESLKQMEVNKSGVFRMGTQSSGTVENSGFFRRGEVGDWKNHLSRQMIERLDRITEQKFEGYDLKF